MTEQEKDAFRVFMLGLYDEIAARNRFMGRPVRPEEEWNAMTDEQRLIASIEAVAMVSSTERAMLIQAARGAIREENTRR